MARNILVFGAGDNQVPLIKACRDLGYFTLVTDPNPHAPGAALADFFAVLPPKDADAHRKLIKEQGVEGIVTCQMENPLALMAELAQEFGFLFPKPEVIRRARNKYLMKQAFLQHGVPCANGLLIETEAQLHEIDFSTWQFPLIIKPVDSFSSRGVKRVDNRAELFAAYAESVRFSAGQQVLIEEFLEGPEVSVESVTYQGKTTVVQITDKVITPYPYTVELAHYQPSALPREVCQAMREMVVQAIAAIGIDNSGSHAELKFTTQGPKMIEIGARLGGDYISSHLTFLSTGVDMNRAVAQVAMNETPDLQAQYKNYSGIKYVNWEPGKQVVSVQSMESFLQQPTVAHADIFVKPGEVLPQVTDSAKRHGFFITCGSSRDHLLQNMQYLSDKFQQLLQLN
jgi:carbamoyl-phosphate synthase large subunit